MEFNVYPDYAALTAYTGVDEKIIVPETVEGGPVTVIGAAFYANDNIKEIVLPSTVKKIGSRACGYCSKLKQINIPDGVKEIGYGISPPHWRILENMLLMDSSTCGLR